MNTTSPKYKLFKAIGTFLAFIILVSILKALFFISFFFFIFVLIFRSAIKHKEKTGSWPMKFVSRCPCSTHCSQFGDFYYSQFSGPCYSPFDDPWSPLSTRIGSPGWESNSGNRGSMAWHAHHTFDRNA